MKHPPDEVAPVTVNVPALIARQIGRIMIRYAYIDWRLLQIVYKLLRLGATEGRLAVREPRTEDASNSSLIC